MVKRLTTRILPLLAAAIALGACGGGPADIAGIGEALRKAVPGDTLVIRGGTYSGTDLRWRADASADSPVVVRPETPGGVILTGDTRLHISGEGLTVSGLLFEGCTPEGGAVVEFRDGDSLARGCRLTECAFVRCVPRRRDIQSGYVQLYGRGDRVDHCTFLDKLNLGVTLTVMLNWPLCDDNRHSIDHNWFGPRPVYGSNGAETIRVGTSLQCMQDSRTLISDNLFERCDGEVEVISIKSCENVIRDNVFYECQGVLALRHGDRNLAEGNTFIGHGVRNTGGIRVVGEDQVIRGNKFIGLAGKRFFSALALMYAVPNSLPNRYMQVKRTVVEDNLFEGCAAIESDTGKDMERTLPPVGTVWRSNVVRDEVTFADPSLEQLREGRGASWYVPGPAAAAGRRRLVAIGSSDDLPAAVGAAPDGTDIVLADGLYLLDRSIPVRSEVSITAAPGAHPEIRYAGDKTGDMVQICDGAALRLRGLHFSGAPIPGKATPRNIIATASDMVEQYRLGIEDCTFSDCGEGGCFAIRGGKGTFADSVAVRGCTFRALSGDAVYFAAETDDKGRYSCDDLIVEGCSFERVLGTCVNVYRGGSDESTAGPYVHIRGCSFVEASNRVRGAALRLIGPQVLEVSGCSFRDSGRGGSSIRLDEAPWEQIVLRDNSFISSGPVRRNIL